MYGVFFVFFFFQAEDGIRDADVTGVQTCALPIFAYELLHALQAVKAGDFSVRMAADQMGVLGKIADTFNEIASSNQRMAQQLERVGQDVGRDGKISRRVRFNISTGAWGEMEGSINTLIDDLLWPT